MTLSLRSILLTAGLAVLLGLAGIGLASAAGLASAPGNRGTTPGSPTAAQAATAESGAAVPDGAVVDPAVASELDALLAADTTTTAPGKALVRGALRRLAAARHLVHATVIVDLPKLGLTTVALDHGTVSAVSGSSLTIAEAGGGSVTVTLGADTRVRRSGAKAAIADLKSADEVFVMSRVAGGVTEAYLVVVPKA